MPDLPTIQRVKRKSRKLNDQLVIAQTAAGYTPAQIAKQQGVAPSTITRFLANIKPELDAVAVFKQQRADLLASLQGLSLEVQRKLILRLDSLADALTPHQIAACMMSISTVHGTLFDKERLERGQSSHNISVLSKLIDTTISSAYDPVTQPVGDSASSAHHENVSD